MPGSQQGSDKLNEVMVPIRPSSDVQHISGYVESQMIAAGYMEGGKDSCQVNQKPC